MRLWAIKSDGTIKIVELYATPDGSIYPDERFANEHSYAAMKECIDLHAEKHLPVCNQYSAKITARIC